MIGTNSTRLETRLQWGACLVLVTALVGGIYGRLAGFGGRQLAVDEYYFAEAADKIRMQGVPRFDGGGGTTFRGCCRCI